MLGRNPDPRALAVAFASLLLAGQLLSGCASQEAKQQQAWLVAMQQDLGALADKGDIGSMNLIADIELLRAQGYFSDSLATALTKLPGGTYFEYAPSGEAPRKAQAADITTLLEFTGEETLLLNEAVITADEAAEVRRLALDNMTAAADMASQFKSRRSPQ